VPFENPESETFSLTATSCVMVAAGCGSHREHVRGISAPVA
jgi:hypothetical protein